MLFVQATTGRALADERLARADLRPFYGGTYFPPTPVRRPGFAAVLDEISRAWQEDRDGVMRSAAMLTNGSAASRQPRRLSNGGARPDASRPR